MPATADIGQKAMNRLELELIKMVLYPTADLINALMADGVPYTKVVVGGSNVPAIQ